MPTRIAINGFGRIGRLTLRNLLQDKNVKVVAINDLTDNKTLAHLFKYDTAHGIFAGEVSSTDTSITINGKEIVALSEKNPAALPWKKLKVDVVLECTGIFTSSDKAGLHLQAGAKKVIISAPAKGSDIPTIVLGVNDDLIKSSNSNIFSNASCTTNCLTPVAKIVLDNWGFVQGSLTTTHAYTMDQNLQDAPHKDLRRARAAALNIIPTSTGAAAATAEVLPSLKGKMFAMSFRVPVITGSMIELNVIVEKVVTKEEINATFKRYADGSMKGILEYSDAPLVSGDIVSNKHSCIFDSELTDVNGKMIKIIAWYDNEAGYSARLADLATKIM